MERSQGSLEYLIILAAVLAIGVIVVIILNYLVAPGEDIQNVNADKYTAALLGVEFVGYDTFYNPGNPASTPAAVVVDGTTYNVVEGAPPDGSEWAADIGVGTGGGDGSQVWTNDDTGDAYIVPEDADSDGFPNDQDNCRFVPNPDQLDYDQDGLGDVCDADMDGDGWHNVDETPETCGTDPLDETSVPADPDSDGVCTPLDNCPNDYNPEQVFICGLNAKPKCTNCEGEDFNNIYLT